MSCNILPEVYAFDISRADSAAELHRMKREIEEEETMSDYEKEPLLEQISERFCQLNLAANPNPKPRW